MVFVYPSFFANCFVFSINFDKSGNFDLFFFLKINNKNKNKNYKKEEINFEASSTETFKIPDKDLAPIP